MAHPLLGAHEEAYVSGPDGLIEWARILTRDVPGLSVDPLTLMELSLAMSAHARAHKDSVWQLLKDIGKKTIPE